MPPGKQLTDRDLDLLKGLATCGVFTHEQARKIYNNVTNYHYQRLSQLEARGYIRCTRYAKYIEITPAGMKAIGKDTPPVRKRQESAREKLTHLSEIYLGLSDWRYLSSREVKKEMAVGSTSIIDAYIEQDGQGYAVYLLSKEPRKTTIQSIKGSLRKLWTHRISRAVIFAPSPDAMNAINDVGSKLESLLVLPFPYGINLLAQKDQIEAEVKSRLQGFTPSSRPFADYEKDNTLVSVLAFNDTIKRDALSGYLKYAAEREFREVKIACLKDQAQKFGQLFPGVEQIIIN